MMPVAFSSQNRASLYSRKLGNDKLAFGTDLTARAETVSISYTYKVDSAPKTIHIDIPKPVYDETMAAILSAWNRNSTSLLLARLHLIISLEKTGIKRSIRELKRILGLYHVEAAYWIPVVLASINQTGTTTFTLTDLASNTVLRRRQDPIYVPD